MNYLPLIVPGQSWFVPGDRRRGSCQVPFLYTPLFPSFPTSSLWTEKTQGPTHVSSLSCWALARQPRLSASNIGMPFGRVTSNHSSVPQDRVGSTVVRSIEGQRRKSRQHKRCYCTFGTGQGEAHNSRCSSHISSVLRPRQESWRWLLRAAGSNNYDFIERRPAGLRGRIRRRSC